MNRELARTIRLALNSPRDVCMRLGLINGVGSYQRQANGVLIRCPWHDERTPSCSVTLGADGTIRVRCHGCSESGDLLTLIAAVHRLDVRRDFQEILRIGGELAGVDIEDASRSRSAWIPRTAHAAANVKAEPERVYPPIAQVDEVWSRAGYIVDDAEARAVLERRGLDAETIDDRALARVIAPDTTLPRWAWFRRRPWTETGHRLILPVYDSNGSMRSIRAWRLTETDAPKRLPPSGYSTFGLVLADACAAAVLEHGEWVEGMSDPLRVIIAEGEPDFLTWATHFSDGDEDAPVILAVAGSGSWTDAIAARIPDGSHAVIRTDHDRAGDDYAIKIARALLNRCRVQRSRPFANEGSHAA